ncbi:mechanosensitive ion channel domain-containing protein [Gloeocapsa sp. PCC 73106]|uniref:mechanosensitive ion channel domain-containing protein n=1 Tax=Gloeocapsa sp. PCC 73106 TaxID=102232 RepID=UPI0002ACDA48|nr:mechanosensitive ion channel domain-containing protein [Gloeocapsa sp. PCC 73106]ELR98902.1 small-conductance mechanosensitive channel [Gloeocapsa sp. PCC 73106]
MPVLIWALILILGFPLLVILLGELSYRLQQGSGLPWAFTVRAVRNLVLPVLAFLLFVRYILKLSSTDDLVRIIETLFWLCIIHAALSLLNTILFAQAGVDTWQARVPKLLVDLSRLFLVLLGAGIVLATVWRADLAGLVTALGVSSLVIGLALQDTLGSVMSGIALLFERPFTVGDWLRVGDIVGQVIDINWRAVRLQTLEREMVVIPHKLIGSDIVRNFSRPQRLHAERVRIGFSYNDPPNLAKQVLNTTALETEGILINPPPEIFTISYDDFAITYEVKFFIEDYGNLEVIRDRFVTRIWYAAQRNHLNIPFPIRTLYHFDGATTLAEGTEKKLTQSWQSLHHLVPLDQPKNLNNLSRDPTLQHFGAGEQVVKQGNFNSDLFVIISGQAIMTLLDIKGQEHEILSLNSGEFFGVMSLFSSEPSPVSIVAVDDLEVMKISQEVVNQMLERQSSFVRELSQVIQIHRKAVQDFSDSTKLNI